MGAPLFLIGLANSRGKLLKAGDRAQETAVGRMLPANVAASAPAALAKLIEATVIADSICRICLDVVASQVGKLCPRLILEGTRLTGKTDLAFAMKEDPRFVGSRKYRYHTPLISAEWGGLTDSPWGESLLVFKPVLPAEILSTTTGWSLGIHMLFTTMFLIYFPFSKLTHTIGSLSANMTRSE